MKKVAFALVLVCLFSSGKYLRGQGFKTDSVFQHFDVDHMNVSDLTSVVRIPVFSWAQRGSVPSLDFVLTANTPVWYASSYCVSDGYNCTYFYNHDIPSPTQLMSFPNPGWFGPVLTPTDFPYITSRNYTFADPATHQTYTYYRSYVVDDSGASHQLWVDANNPSTFRTIDGTGYMVDANGLKDRNGRAISNYWNNVPATNTIVDNDNNTLTWTIDAASNRTWQDTVGRSITFSQALDTDISACPTPPPGSPTPTNKTLLNVAGYASPFVLCYTNINISTNFWGRGPGVSVTDSGPGDCAGDPGCPAAISTTYLENSVTEGVLQSLKLPDGRVWMFLYDSAPDSSNSVEAYGEITRIIEPTKGSIWYCYKHDWTKPDAIRTPNGNAASIYIAERVIDSDPNAPAYQCGSFASANGRSIWRYSPGGASVGGYSNTVTDPLGNDEKVTYVTDSVYTQYQTNTRTDTYYIGNSTSNNKLKSVAESIQAIRLPYTGDPSELYYSFADRNTTKSTTIDNIATETDSVTYDNTFKPAIQICGLGPTITTCQYKAAVATGIGQIVSQSNGIQTQSTTYQWSNGGPFADANLLDAPQTTTVSDSGSSSQTNYFYDDGDYVSNSGKGHLTRVTRVNDAGPSVTTYTHYDSHGMPDVKYDGKQHATNITYDSTYHVFPITISKEDVSDSYSYNLNTGAMLSHTDNNGQITQYGYDVGGRPLSVQVPGQSGNQYATTLCYPDSNTAKIFQAQTNPITGPSADGTTCGSSSDDTIVKTLKADGLGRVVSTILDSAPGGAVQSDTSFDAWDRVTYTSTPHLATTGATSGTTTHYDEIGRVKEVDTPFGVKSWSYAGLTAKSTDERQNRKWVTTDVMGRTSWVLEPTGPNVDPTIPTSYSYNVFGLTGVTQAGVIGEQPRTRSFRYNKLGQLKGAYNPETGLVCYGESSAANIDLCSPSYDLNGNLLAKTDARGITVYFGYDNSDRLISKTYSGGPSQLQTLSSCFEYGTSATGNRKGRLTNEWTQQGPCSATLPSSGVWTKRSIAQYDAFGRVLQEERCSGNSCMQNRPHQFTYQSDLQGNLTVYSDGRQHFDFHVDRDGAGRIRSLGAFQGSSSVSSLYRMTGSSPAGVTDYTLGDHITVQKTFDPYLRLQGLTANRR